MPHPLFIYGTLHPNRAPAEIAVTARLLESLGRATIQGRLFNLGEYPGVILSNSPADIVPGELFQFPDDPMILARLDAYEDFRPDNPGRSLFLRQRVYATLLDNPDVGKKVACWVYTYNRPLA
jgi:gamma-glutamylcyclotransferase (GGCT)/AIG2-like uncharacterized protein YtfP